MAKPVPVSVLVERYGFTSRHWTRLAAMGKVPGARQPFGPHGRWVFDPDVVARWWDAQRRQVSEWPTFTGGAKSGGRGRRRPVKNFAVPSKQDLKASLANVLGRGSTN